MTEINNESNGQLQLFVAMPYTDFGEHAKWKKPQDVERFYELVRKKIEDELDRPVHLHIERYSPESGLVIDGMFRAIYDADIFIADLTGCNANVFLELGIRFGVSKKVTILTTQEDRSLPFDLNQMRYVRYANRVSQDAEEEIAQIVSRELYSEKVCSPVLSLLDVEVVPRKNWEILAGVRVDALLAESRRTSNSENKLNYVNEAIEIDPFSLKARLELARLLRTLGDFEQATSATEVALKTFPHSAELYKERGVIFDRMTTLDNADPSLLDKAIAAYDEGLKRDSQDADLHCCYGGALRRKGLGSAASEKQTHLEKSLEHYRHGLSLERHSTYAGLNVLRLLMLLAGSSDAAKVEDYKQRMYHLCAFEVADSQINLEDGQWWRMFDLADVFALMDKREESLDTYQKAIEIIPESQRKDTLVSPVRTWKELLTTGKMDRNAEDILYLLESHMGRKQHDGLA